MRDRHNQSPEERARALWLGRSYFTIRSMTADELQSLCEKGSELLMRTDYLAAEEVLMRAEQIALAGKDWDTLARLYMPLQETRRQIRQRCGEGVVKLDLIASGPLDRIDAESILNRFPHGQLLVAGWDNLGLAMEVRRLARQRRLFVETFLASVHRAGRERAIVIYPSTDLTPPNKPTVLVEDDFPRGERAGTAQTYAEIMDLWERLHAPSLLRADQTSDPLEKIDAYRKTIEIDNACEFAHQRLADTARSMARRA